MTIYGWHEQNECSWGLNAIEINLDCIETVDTDGLITFCGSRPDGEWYATFLAAKRAALAYWRERRDNAKRALSYVSKLNQADARV